MKPIRHITLPRGFLAAGVKCGIKASGKEDLALIVGAKPVAAALLTTSNQVFGAPVAYSRAVLPKGYGTIRGIVINSGCSNVATGARGRKDAADMAAAAAKAVGAKPDEMLVASTGIIGHHLPMEKVRRGIAAAAGRLGTDSDQFALRAMMTTDTREKSAVVQTRVGRETLTVAGVVKGVGMIAPALTGPHATMIAVVTTDAEIAPPELYKLWRRACAISFNAVTVDSDQSTSDTAVVMASGCGPSVAAAPARKKFAAALEEVCTELAMAIARDGEGATRLVIIDVIGAASDRDAEIAAKSVANSPLFKTAVHGADPNWGRIAMAVGKSAAKVDPDKLSIKIGPVTLFSRGRPRAFDAAAVSELLKAETVRVRVDMGLGKGKFTAYTCDLSREYITINADYHT